MGHEGGLQRRLGADCGGTFGPQSLNGSNVELQCNDCGAVVGVVQIDVLRELLELDV
jgi:hypothetical protein